MVPILDEDLCLGERSVETEPEIYECRTPTPSVDGFVESHSGDLHVPGPGRPGNDP